jgi:hypothetical protein
LNGGSSATVSVTVDCVDDPPTALGDHATVAQGSGATVIAVTANDADVDGGPKRIASLTQPAHGAASARPDGETLSYTPGKGYCTGPSAAPDSFTYTLNGGSTATVAVTVTCAAERPHVALSIAHPHAALRHGLIVLRLSCRGPRGHRCFGRLALTAIDSGTHRPAGGTSHARFNLAVGSSQHVKMTPTQRLLSTLRRSSEARARIAAVLHVHGRAVDQPPPLLILVTPERRR